MHDSDPSSARVAGSGGDEAAGVGEEGSKKGIGCSEIDFSICGSLARCRSDERFDFFDFFVDPRYGAEASDRRSDAARSGVLRATRRDRWRASVSTSAMVRTAAAAASASFGSATAVWSDLEGGGAKASSEEPV